MHREVSDFAARRPTFPLGLLSHGDSNLFQVQSCFLPALFSVGRAAVSSHDPSVTRSDGRLQGSLQSAQIRDGGATESTERSTERSLDGAGISGQVTVWKERRNIRISFIFLAARC